MGLLIIPPPNPLYKTHTHDFKMTLSFVWAPCWWPALWSVLSAAPVRSWDKTGSCSCWTRASVTLWQAAAFSTSTSSMCRWASPPEKKLDLLHSIISPRSEHHDVSVRPCSTGASQKSEFEMIVTEICVFFFLRGKWGPKNIVWQWKGGRVRHIQTKLNSTRLCRSFSCSFRSACLFSHDDEIFVCVFVCFVLILL